MYNIKINLHPNIPPPIIPFISTIRLDLQKIKSGNNLSHYLRNKNPSYNLHNLSNKIQD